MNYTYAELEKAVATLSTEHKASGYMAHKYLEETRDGRFADNAFEYLQETVETILNVREDIFMHNEASVVRHALKELTQLDFYLIRFFHGSTIRVVEYPMESVEHSMEFFRMRRCLDSYLFTRDASALEELIVSAKAVLKMPKGVNSLELEAIFEEIWLCSIVN